MDNKNVDLTFAGQKIQDVPMGKRVEGAFLQYAMSVIMSRALPDVRDGLKPVHRRILYAMFEDHLTSDKPFRKSATTVGNVLGRYHPHGDAAVYDSMVRLAQPFSLRYPLVEGHGNFGNVDGDGAAAYRYTEARLSKIANEMLSDLDKEVVDFVPNFDNKLREPSVLPCRYPNLLVNGTVGIAVGMATNIPPHNLGEVIDGTIYLMEHPDATIPELMQFIKGPDFPTAATIYGLNGIVDAYTTGRGKVMVRAKADLDEEHHRITVTEIPYMVNKTNLVESIADCVKDKRIEGIRDMHDGSGKDGMQIVIDCHKDANLQIILNQLYKYTQMQDTCAINMLALVGPEPKVLNLKQILEYYIAHQEEVITRRVQYDLDKALREAHINEGYKIAIDFIDEVIAIIRRSENVAAAKIALSERFSLTDAQAQAIVSMTLGKLSGMERQKVEERLAELHAKIEEYQGILASEGKVKDIIKTEMTEIKRRYADARRTQIVASTEEIVLEDLIEKHTCVITMSHTGYIKRMASDIYTAQHRGGKGLIGMTTKEEDFVEQVVAVHSHDYILLFTDTGKIHVRKSYQIPEAGRTAKGTSIVNVLELGEGEKITAMVSVPAFSDTLYLTMVTKKGIIKRTLLSEYEYARRGGKIAIHLAEDDKLVNVLCTGGADDLMIASKKGNANRFHESAVRAVGRTAGGVKGMNLEDGDEVIGALKVEADKTVLTITENGFGKRTSFAEYNVRGRGTRGVFCHALSEKTGDLCGFAAVKEDDDLVMMTAQGQMIRMPVSDIPEYRRQTTGVIVMRLEEGDSVCGFARIPMEVDEPADADGAEEPENPEDLTEAETQVAADSETEAEKPDGDSENE